MSINSIVVIIRPRLPLFLLLGLFTLIIVFLTFSRTSPPTTQTTTPTTPLPIPTLHQAPSSPNFIINLPPVNIYPQAAIYQVTDFPLPPQETAALFGFNQNPVTTPSQSSTTLRWYDPDLGRFTLTLSQPPHLLFQIPVNTPPSPAPLPQNAHESVLSLLQQKGLLNPDLPPLLLESEYQQTNGYLTKPATSREDGQLTFLNYAYNLDNKPLFLTSAPLHSLTAHVNQQLQVTNLSLIPPPHLNQITETTLISTQEAIILLKNNQGTLVSAIPNIPSETTPKLNFSQVKIDSFDLIYLLLPESNLIKPVYRFTGTAPDTKLRIIHHITYLTPATTD